MKTPEELFKLMEEEMPFNILPNSKIKPYILELIGLAQKDAYNQALDDAAILVEERLKDRAQIRAFYIDGSSILKLKKQ